MLATDDELSDLFSDDDVYNVHVQENFLKLASNSLACFMVRCGSQVQH